MEFREFNNPERRNYDVTSSLRNNNNVTNTKDDYYVEQLLNLIGLLEDIDEDELQEKYGISINEYIHPNENTIIKITNKLNEAKTQKRR